MNQRNGLSQEGLKLIACLTMLIDHIGSVFLPGMFSLRMIGRIAFPIYCFLLVEGAHYTRNPKRYALRLLIGALLSEIPFDLALSGWFDMSRCSVMVTLLLGYGMILAMKALGGVWKGLVVVPFIILAELLGTDYGGNGIAIIAWLALVREKELGALWRLVGLSVLLWFGSRIPIGPVRVPLELFGLFALIPIQCYRGGKRTRSQVVQWCFYLFYPVHLLVLWLIRNFVILF